MTMDYGFFRRQLLPLGTKSVLPHYEIFLSAYNLSDRVRHVYDHVSASRKLWLVHHEYGLGAEHLPVEEHFISSSDDESSFWKAVLNHLALDPNAFSAASVCIDSTGMLRPHLLFVMRLLHRFGASRVSFLYAEPTVYKQKELTSFSAGSTFEVRPVQGYEGTPTTDSSADYLIIGMGYDDRMIAEVAEDRAKADKHQLFGLPSLSADMYQQSVIRSRRAAEELSDPNFSEANRSFAPASDPFGTAAVLSEVVHRRRQERGISNLYLSPLGTKPQVIGFGLYHIFECTNGEASVTFPFSRGYSPETGQGISRLWQYEIEF